MTDLNTASIIGRLTRDVQDKDFAYTSGGTARLNISIVVNRSEKRGGEWGDKASYFDVTVWGKTAESVRPYLTKGKQVAVSGYLDQQRWERDGQKFSKVVIIANSMLLLGGKDGGAPQRADVHSDAWSDDPDGIPF